MNDYKLRTSKRGATRAVVADLTAKGLDPRTIALKLGLSVPGVHYHLKKIKAEAEQKEGAA